MEKQASASEHAHVNHACASACGQCSPDGVFFSSTDLIVALIVVSIFSRTGSSPAKAGMQASRHADRQAMLKSCMHSKGHMLAQLVQGQVHRGWRQPNSTQEQHHMAECMATISNRGHTQCALQKGLSDQHIQSALHAQFTAHKTGGTGTAWAGTTCNICGWDRFDPRGRSHSRLTTRLGKATT